MFTQNGFVLERSKTITLNIPIGTIANSKVYFPTDGFLSSKKIIGLTYLDQNLPQGVTFNFNGNQITPIGANAHFYTLTLIEKGTGVILLEQSPLKAFTTLALTQNAQIKRLNKLSVGFQDSYVTYMNTLVSPVGTPAINFTFYYE